MTQRDIFPKRYTNGQGIYEKVLDSSKHPGNANQNHNEFSPHILLLNCTPVTYWISLTNATVLLFVRNFDSTLKVQYY